MPSPARSLAQRLLAGDRRALARGISLVEDGTPAGAALVAEVYPRTGRAAVTGFTGPPGAGKSTLIGALVGQRRAAGRRVGVLSVDPSSPLAGGALLGDRIRLAEHFLDPGVFIRSMATRGALGGLAEAALGAALLMDAAGHEEVLLETVGVGQAEVDVADHADLVVLVLMAGAGDSVQALKAGIMEIPDLVVVNKADQPGAKALAADLRAVLGLAPAGERPSVLLTEGATGTGVAELTHALDALGEARVMSGERDGRRRRQARAQVVELAAAGARRALTTALAADPALERLLDAVHSRRTDPGTAAAELHARAKRFRS